MPFCAKCGTQINDGARFCPSCGNAYGQNPKPINTTAPVAQKPKTTKKRSNKGLIFTLVGVCAAAIIAVILFCCLGDSADPKRATPEAALQGYFTALGQSEVARDMNVIEYLIPSKLQKKYPKEAEESISKNLRRPLKNSKLTEEIGDNFTATIEKTDFQPWDFKKLGDFNADLHITGLQATEGGTLTYQYTMVGTKGIDGGSSEIEMVKIDGEWYPAGSEFLEEFLALLEDSMEQE